MGYLRIIILALVFGAGFLTSYLLLKPEIVETVEVVTKHETDTVYQTIRDTVIVTDLKHQVLRDTILLEPYKPKISRFDKTFELEYGDAYVSGEVLGEVTKLGLTTDFSVPTVTNTITNSKTVTRTIQTKGVFIGGMINQELIPIISASYINKDWSFDATYTPETKLYGFGIKRRIF